MPDPSASLPQDASTQPPDDLSQLAFDAAELGAWRWDVARDEIILDRRAQACFGMASPLTAAGLYEAIQAQDLSQVQHVLACVCAPDANDRRFEIEFSIIGNDEAARVLFVCGQAYCARDGQRVTRLAGIVRAHRASDVTQSSVDAVRLEAQRLARERSEFLANMSHEIRTPLHAVIGLSQLGVRENFGRRSMETFQRILDSGQLLLAVVDDLLDYAKLEAGKAQVERVPYALGTAIDKAVDLLAPQAYAKHLDLIVEEAPNLPVTCLGDSLRVSQVLANLLSNAVKFTASGRITLSVLRAAGAIVFKVSDTGVGMSDEMLTRLFQPFEQADRSTTRRFGGTGLGLVIARRFVELMGGAIRAESAAGQGSTFEVQLPLAGETGESEPASGRIALLGLTNEEAARLISGFSQWGIDAAEAAGTAAFAAPGELVVFSPAGAESETLQHAAQALRAGKRVAFVRTPGRADVPLAFLNVRTLIFDRPLRVRQCVNALRNRLASGALLSLATPRLQGMRVLAAEDSEVSRVVLEDLLAAEGATVTITDNGRLAVERLRVDGPDAYDVLLTDIQMPEMDGYETAVRCRELAPRLPVIGVTARAGDAERSRCFAAGMVGHVAKPIDIDVLIALIRRQCAHPGAEPAPVHRLPVTERTPTSADHLQWIDWAAFEARYQGRSWMIERLITTALRNHRDTAARMRSAAAARDFTTVAFLAHALKGLAGNFCVAALAALAGETEELAQQSDAAALACADRLAALADRLMVSLAARRKSA